MRSHHVPFGGKGPDASAAGVSSIRCEESHSDCRWRQPPPRVHAQLA
jgi:hypothetical protein